MTKAVENTKKEPIIPSPEQYQELLLSNQKLQQDNEYLKQQLNELKRLIFGIKSERFIPTNNNQLSLFGNPEETPSPLETEQINYIRTKQEKKKEVPVRTALPAHLPRIEEIIEPEDLPEGANKIGEEVTEILEFTPGKAFVKRIVRPKYANPNKEGIKVAELPSLPLPKSNAGASILAYILVSKFVDHLPFYRQIQIFKRQQLTLSDSTINGWFNASTDLLNPLYQVLKKKVFECDYLQADESPIGVQDSHKKGALHTGYQWVYRSPMERLILFKYAPSRKGEVPQADLENFLGSLQTDGYQGYRNLKTNKKIILLACMAHARRYFDKALSNDKQRAEHVLSLMQLLYDMERNVREREISFEIRYRYRQLYAKPILQQLRQWLDTNLNETLPKSAIGKAIAYTLNLWPELSRYIEDGRYEIDNNLIENAIRPLALGRKNYMFAGSHKAAQRAAMMYSFFSSCKINAINPLEWLTDVLRRIADHKANQLEELLPQNWKADTVHQ